VLGDGSGERTGLALEGMGLLIGYLFETFALRRVYVEVPEFNLPQFGRQIERFAELEGRYRDHVHLADRYWDLLTYAIDRNRWAQRIAPLFGTGRADR
jgi:RimJ/RimL family protein N-acetyltransferase